VFSQVSTAVSAAACGQTINKSLTANCLPPRHCGLTRNSSLKSTEWKYFRQQRLETAAIYSSCIACRRTRSIYSSTQPASYSTHTITIYRCIVRAARRRGTSLLNGCHQWQRMPTTRNKQLSYLHIILNAVRCPYVTYVRSSVTMGVASSVANDGIMRMTS